MDCSHGAGKMTVCAECHVDAMGEFRARVAELEGDLRVSRAMVNSTAKALTEHQAALERIGELEVDAGRYQRLRPEVRAFAALMEIKLRMNDHKTHWREVEGNTPMRKAAHWLQKQQDSAERLEVAFLNASKEDIAMMAADIANYSMMAADEITSLDERKLFGALLEHSESIPLADALRTPPATVTTEEETE